MYDIHVQKIYTRVFHYQQKTRSSYSSHYTNLVWSTMRSLKKFLSDNGGEFENPNFSSICENLNFYFFVTEAESPQ